MIVLVWTLWGAYQSQRARWSFFDPDEYMDNSKKDKSPYYDLHKNRDKVLTNYMIDDWLFVNVTCAFVRENLVDMDNLDDWNWTKMEEEGLIKPTELDSKALTKKLEELKDLLVRVEKMRKGEHPDKIPWWIIKSKEEIELSDINVKK
jgi:hypothetical protein